MGMDLSFFSIRDRQSRFRLDRALLRRITLSVLAGERPGRSAEISLNFVRDAEIRPLNRDYHGSDVYTDVLAFPLERSGEKIVADIVVSTDTALRQAAVFDTSLRHEVYLYVIHGMLHICGYDDLTPGDRTVMRRKEREYLKKFNL